MGLFGNEPRSQQDSVDRYLASSSDNPRAVLRPQSGEFQFRVHGQTKYAVIRESLLKGAQRAGAKFWQGKVLLEFTLEANYYGRAVIQDDLIGNVVHLFVDPVNRLS
jgi:hypothetical protein